MLDKLIMFAEASKIIEYLHIFSRTSPAQKGIIVSLLNHEGHVTLMCGDGTNDVGSLKRADVGLAIVNNREPTKEEKKKRKELMGGMNPMAMMKKMQSDPQLKGKSMAEIQQHQQKQMADFQKEMAALSGGDQLELGDACIAAPFTFKYTSIKSVKKVIR